MAEDAKYGHVAVERTPGEPFGDDEPVFIIRGRDVAAPVAVRRYAQVALEFGADGEHVNGAHAVADRIEEWQRAHPELVKVPDTDPA